MAQVQLQQDQHTPADLTNCQYRVDNWQIPVPIGDASAHFLVEVVDPKPKVINAFFMDGGDNAQHHGGDDTAWGKISQALRVIDKAYGNAWKFDAIVTTHHDRDHYHGLEDLLPMNTTRPNHQGTTYRDAYFRANLTYYSGNPGQKDNQGHLVFKWKPTNCTTIIAGEKAIGVDIFSRTRMFQRHGNVDLRQWDDANGIRTWTYNTRQVRRPRFAIVGANGFGVRLDSTAQITTNAKGPTENQKSILAVVYWPQDGHTSYFTGGDGNPEVELVGVVPWMDANKSTPNHFPQLPIDMIKLDHHGSLNETLDDKGVKDWRETIISKMEPKTALVTPGNKHGHPNWVILELLKGHFNKSLGSSLYTTRSPYWFTKENINMLDANTNHAGYKKVQRVFGNKKAQLAKRNQIADPSLNDDMVFMNDMDFWSQQNTDAKKYKDEYIEYLRQGTNSTDYFDSDGEPKGKEINQRIKKDGRKMVTDLRGVYRVKSGAKTATQKEEPEYTDILINKREGQENRNTIPWKYKKVWSEMCDQEICEYGSPYFLVRFWFESGVDPVVDGTMDETGKEKPKQKDLATTYNLAKRPLTFESTKEVNNKGHEVFGVTTKKPKKDGSSSTHQDKYEHTDGMGSFRNELAYIRSQMHNFNLAEYFSNCNIKFMGENQINPLDKITKTNLSGPQSATTNALHPASGRGKSKIKPTKPKTDMDFKSLSEMTDPYQNPETAPSSKPVGRGKNKTKQDIIELADFSESYVKDFTQRTPGKGTLYTGGMDQLLDFRDFVKTYCNKDITKFTTTLGPDLKGCNDKEKKVVGDMYEQWKALQDIQLAAASQQYREWFESVYRPLKNKALGIKPKPASQNGKRKATPRPPPVEDDSDDDADVGRMTRSTKKAPLDKGDDKKLRKNDGKSTGRKQQ